MYGKKIGNKWWKIMPIYSKEMKQQEEIGIEDTIKENRRMYTHGGRCGGMGGKNPKNQRQGRKCRGEDADGK
jgi:hypothetical protein